MPPSKKDGGLDDDPERCPRKIGARIVILSAIQGIRALGYDLERFPGKTDAGVAILAVVLGSGRPSAGIWQWDGVGGLAARD
ncbi:MAG TPA: hypothetical protein VLB76_20005 [Thermoanaerobaculia bacterium]|nr:hypothetical protein [Thermoanaerobaculia bacterium]